MKDPIKLADPVKVNIVDQNKRDLEAYAEEVVSNRAVINIYGFKPVHMLLLYCAYATTKMTNSTKKCARLVGDMLGAYHPHGDVSTYDALLAMVNWYDCYIPLFKKQGNFGSYQGDGPASYRYTETALTPFAMDCIIGDLAKSQNVVDWTKNYDESTKQPVFLPIKVPIILINGTEGIAIGVKVDVPSHNINEVIDATVALLDNPNASVVLKPDHCMPGCEIVDTNWKAISNNGVGTYVVRSKIDEGEYKGYPALFIRSLPNKTRLDPIKNAIEELKFTTLPQIISIHEDCTPTNLNCIIKFKKGTDLGYAKQILYKKTNLQKTFRVNFQVYDGSTHQIVNMSYKSYLQFFIEFRKATLFRLYSSKYQDLMTKIHALKSYVLVGSNAWIDCIVSDVRENRDMSDQELIEMLIGKYSLTDLQASFIIHNDIAKLSRYHITRYKEQLMMLEQEAEICYKKIVDESELIKEIREELLAIKQKYGCPRRCKIVRASDLDGVPDTVFKIVITEKNCIYKTIPDSKEYRFKNDKPKMILTVNNVDNVLIFDTKGKVYKFPVNNIPLAPTDIRVLIKDLVADICTVISESKINQLSKSVNAFYLIPVTRTGFIKKMECVELRTVSTKGSTYMKLEDDDYVQDMIFASENVDIIVYSRSKAIRFPISEVPTLSRTARGTRSMDTPTIDGVSVITSNTTDIVVITDNGYLNRFKVEGLKSQSRGCKGLRVIKLHKDDYIKIIYGVNEADSMRFITNTTDITVPVKDMAEASSVSPGNKVINTREIILKCQVIKA